MELVTVQTFDNYFSANILLTRMRDAGIECYLKDEYTVTIDPLLSNAIGGIKLVVKKRDEVEARKMLQNGGVSINRKKVEDIQMQINPSLLLHNKYLLVQKGKKNYYLVTLV